MLGRLKKNEGKNGGKKSLPGLFNPIIIERRRANRIPPFSPTGGFDLLYYTAGAWYRACNVSERVHNTLTANLSSDRLHPF